MGQTKNSKCKSVIKCLDWVNCHHCLITTVQTLATNLTGTMEYFCCISCLSRFPPHFYPESQQPSLCHSCFPTLSADDGALRIWKNFADQKNPEMVTAWQGLSDMLPTTRGQPPAGVHSKDQRSILLCAFLPSSPRSYSQNNPCSSSPTALPLHSIPVTLPHTPI